MLCNIDFLPKGIFFSAFPHTVKLTGMADYLGAFSHWFISPLNVQMNCAGDRSWTYPSRCHTCLTYSEAPDQFLSPGPSDESRRENWAWSYFACGSFTLTLLCVGTTVKRACVIRNPQVRESENRLRLILRFIRIVTDIVIYTEGGPYSNLDTHLSRNDRRAS